VVDAKLDGVGVHRQPAAQELDVTHPQRDGLIPADPGVGQREHQNTVPACHVCQPVQVVGGQVDVPPGRLAGQVLYDCPNTATWLAVNHCTPRTEPDRIVVCDWHMKRWLQEVRLIIAWHGYMECYCGRHFTTPESCVTFTPL